VAASRIAGPCLIVDHVTFGKPTLLIAIGAVLVALVVARLAGPGPAAVAAVSAGVAAAAVWQLWLNRQADADRRAALAAAVASHAVPAPALDGGVARFLRPEQEVVAFRPRPELDQLIAWVAADQHSGVQLVTGPGGAGKTRLARELAPRVGPMGFRTWWARPGATVDAAEAARDSGEPGLIVVDYAETRADLTDLLAAVFANQSGPLVRVLLLARSTGEWWQRLINSTGERVARLLTQPPILLGPISVDGGPSALFDEALTAFANKLEFARPDVELMLIGRDPVVLVVHAAALLAVLDHAQENDGDPARSAAEVMDGLLSHEGRYWAQSAAARRLDLDVAVQRLAVAVGCLIGADSEITATNLMLRVPDLADSAERRGRVARWLHDLYPETIPDNAATREWIGPLRPDPVAERLILTELSERPELIPGLFTELSSDQAIRALTVLARAAVRTQAGLGLIRSALASDLEHLAVPAISVAIATNLILGDLLNEALNRQPVSPDVLARLAHAAPHPSFALAPLAATVLTQLVDQSSDIGQRAGRLLDLATWLADLGRWDEGLAAIEEAVAIRRRQVETSPDAFLPDLALSLNNRTAILGTLKRWDEALAAAEEAVSIRRDLARDNPDTVLPDLAQSLNNLSRCLNEMGRPEQALAANEEAVAIRRDSTLDRPEMLFALGAALNNRAISLDALERPAEALVAVEEATRIYRELAATRPDAYLSIFARSLNNQSNSLAALKRRAEALAAAEEAIRVYRILALMRPAAFLSDLADSLHNQSLRLREMGREEDALAAMAEANRIRRQK
jgi:tetratricopeptide (TPR) repeat protein